jgi:hypothetical protein
MSKGKIKIQVSNKRDRSWSAEDRQNFADGNILRSAKHANRKRVANKRACRDKARWD